jgi:hypothetical protein
MEGKEGRLPRGADGGGDLTNVQCKAIQNCHNEFPPVHECMLKK